MMKIIRISIILIVLTIIFGGCSDDLLDKPQKDQVEVDEYFNDANDLEIATNDLTTILTRKGAYTSDGSSDNVVGESVASKIKGTRQAPTNKGSGGWSWGQLRRINFILENYDRVDDEKAKAKYSGITRFYRALFYWKKVKRFGDVPWYSKVIDVEDEDELYKERDPRELVMDSVMADINYAVENIPAEKKLTSITRYTALALKSRIALYEGTYRKYHDELDLDDSERFLKEAASASKELIESGAYTLFKEGGPEESYQELFSRQDQDEQETILAAVYDKSQKKHDISYRLTSPTLGAYGLTKDLVNSYLMKDGSRFTDKDDYETMGFYDEMQNRDPRLTQTVAGPNFTVRGENEREPVDMSITRTGYRIIKALDIRENWGSGASVNDIITYRYAEILLNYAEAKAELGNLTQDDLDMSINALRDRVDMPHLSMSDANANPDDYQASLYSNVDQGSNKGVILEIRRERRIELVMEGFRWDDLMRWKEGTKVNAPMLGVYFDGLGAYDFNNDGKPDVYLYEGDDSGAPDEVPQKARIDVNERPLYDPETGQSGASKGNLDPFPKRGNFEEPMDYLYPLPLQDLTLNDNLEQNSGWETPN